MDMAIDAGQGIFPDSILIATAELRNDLKSA
jgi:hypothetical protein